MAKSNKKSSKNKFNNTKKDTKNDINNEDTYKKEKFYAKTGNSFSDMIDTLSISPSTGSTAVTFQEKFQDYMILVFKYSFLVIVLALNFLGLSVSLNCNADQEMSIRIISAIFAFFFGFVYLVINYYTYKVIGKGQICKMDKEKLFPFKT
jgi:hypothetical protein